MGKLRFRIALAFALPVIVAAAACEEEEPKPPVEQSGPKPFAPGGGDSPTSDGGATDSGNDADAGACTELPITGAQIPQQIVTGDPPVGSGGPLEDGTYVITDATLFGGASAVPGPSGASYEGAIRITGTTFERHVIFRTAGGAVVESAVRGTIDVVSTSPAIDLTCPFAQREQITYTATGNNLIISNVITKESLSFTKQP